MQIEHQGTTKYIVKLKSPDYLVPELADTQLEDTEIPRVQCSYFERVKTTCDEGDPEPREKYLLIADKQLRYTSTPVIHQKVSTRNIRLNAFDESYRSLYRTRNSRSCRPSTAIKSSAA
jgi:hypothetical protein